MKKSITLFLALALVTSLFAVPQNHRMALKKESNSSREIGFEKKSVNRDLSRKVARRAYMADVTTFTYTSISDTAQTKSGITIKIAKGTGTSAPQWNTTSSHLRIYTSNTITISGSGITKVELSCGMTRSDKDYATLTADKGNLVSGGASTGVGDFKTDTWTGDENNVVFTMGTGQRAINQIAVTLGGTGGGGGEESDTIYIDMIRPTILDSIADFGWVYAEGETEEYTASVQVNTTSLVGVYGNDDIDMDYTWLADYSTQSYIDIDSVASVVISQLGDTTQFVMTYICGSTTYIITMKDFPFTPSGVEQTILIEFPSISDYTESYGLWSATGSNEEGYACGLYIQGEEVSMDFTIDDVYLDYTYLQYGEELIEIYQTIAASGSVVEDTTFINFSFYDEAGDKYTVVMKDYDKQPSGEEMNLTFTLPSLSDYSTSEGWFQVMGYDDLKEYYFSLCVNSESLIGSYVYSDLDMQYTYLYFGEDEIQMQNNLTATVSTNGDTTLFVVTAYDKEGVKYNILMKYYVPTPTEIITMTISGATGEYYDTYGDYYIYGGTTNQDTVAFDIYMDELASGTYTMADMDASYSWILYQGNYIEMFSADITLTVTSSTNVSLVATVVGKDAKQYNITMSTGTTPTPPTPGEHTIVIADYKTVKFTTTDSKYQVSAHGKGTAPVYNTKSLDLRVYAKDSLEITSTTGNMTQLVFNLSDNGKERQADLTVNTGVMSYDAANGTVTWTGNASYVYFIVGDKNDHGTKNKGKDGGQFDFTSIDITLNDPTGLMETSLFKIQNSKFILNGQLLILKDGVLYNAQGQVVK